MGYLAMCASLNESELMGVFTFCWSINPRSQAQNNLTQCYRICEYMERLKVHSDEALKKKIDIRCKDTQVRCVNSKLDKNTLYWNC